MTLGYGEIKKRVTAGNLIAKFSEDCLEGAGYDLRVGRAYRILSGSFLGVKDRETPKVSEITEDRITLKPSEYLLVESLEEVNMPEDLMARILPRSSVFRMGCILATAVVDPGYRGTLTMGLSNQSGHDFTFEKKAKMAQIVFEKVYGRTKAYAGKYQGGKVV